MGCKWTKLTISAVCEAEQISSYGEVCRLIPELRLPGRKLKKSVVSNKNLLILVDKHVAMVVSTIKLLATLKLSLSKARKRQEIILQALEHDEEEEVLHKGLKLNYLGSTLFKLKEFNEAEDPFAPLLTNEFTSLCEQQQRIVVEISSKMEEIGENLSSTKKWKKVWKLLHNAAFIAVLVFSVVLAAMAAPPVATVAAAAGCSVIKTTEQWFDSILAKKMSALEGYKEVLLTMKKGEFEPQELESIRAMVKRLEIRIGSIAGDAGYVLNHGDDEIAMKIAMEEIKGKVGVIREWTDKVEMKVARCEEAAKKNVARFFDALANNV